MNSLHIIVVWVLTYRRFLSTTEGGPWFLCPHNVPSLSVCQWLCLHKHLDGENSCRWHCVIVRPRFRGNLSGIEELIYVHRLPIELLRCLQPHTAFRKGKSLSAFPFSLCRVTTTSAFRCSRNHLQLGRR